MSKQFYGLYCGYSQDDIREMVMDIHKRGNTFLMDNYIIRKVEDQIFMEDKWETEPPKELHRDIEKAVLDAITLEYLNKRSRFESLDDLTDYMVREEEADMEEYLRNEEEWEY